MSTIINNIIAFFEFSRNNCLSFCGFLVPANLLLVITTWFLCIVPQNSINWVRYSGTTGNILSLILILHVVSWWKVGVVAGPSFILVGLGGICLTLNFLTIIFYQQIRSFWRTYLIDNFSQKQSLEENTL